MFEVFGWASVRSYPDRVHKPKDREIMSELSALVNECKKQGSVEVRLDPSLNGSLNALTVVGQSNNRYERAIDLFRWLADNAPGSYGLLYMRDDASEYDNEFGVLRLARGDLIETEDPLLSPYFPVVEEPYDKERDRDIWED